MATHDFDTLFRTLKTGELHSVYYLYGAEHQLKDEAVHAILDRILDPGLRDFNLDLRSASDLAPDQIPGICSSLPMMADRRVVVIRDTEAWARKSKGKAAVLAYLERPAPETVLVLVQTSDAAPDADLAKRAWTVELAPLPPERAARWVQHRAEGMQLSLTPEAVEHLVRVTNASLGSLASELAKLSGLSGDDPIGIDRVGALLGVRHGETQFDWRDAIMEGDTARAISLTGPVLQQSGVSGVRLVTLLGTTLVGLGLARTLYDQGKRGRTLESAVFNALRKARLWGIDYKETAAAWSRWAARWPMDRVRAGIRHARWADEALKSTTLSDEGAIAIDLILRLQGSRKAAA